MAIPRSSYYARKTHRPSKTQQENEQLITKIRSIWAQHRFVYGAHKLHFLLKAQGYPISVKRVQRLMRKAGIRSITRRKWRPSGNTTVIGNRANLLNQDFKTKRINQKWTTDITYIKTSHDGWTYLSSVMDAHTRKIIAWDLGKRMTDELVIKTMKKAILASPKPIKGGLIIQTDLGSQYTGESFNRLLDEHQITHSYSRKGTPYDNILIESFHAILKKEEVYQNNYVTFDEAKCAIFQYIEGFYNTHRIHGSLGYLTPQQAEDQAALNNYTKL